MVFSADMIGWIDPDGNNFGRNESNYSRHHLILHVGIVGVTWEMKDIVIQTYLHTSTQCWKRWVLYKTSLPSLGLTDNSSSGLGTEVRTGFNPLFNLRQIGNRDEQRLANVQHIPSVRFQTAKLRNREKN